MYVRMSLLCKFICLRVYILTVNVKCTHTHTPNTYTHTFSDTLTLVALYVGMLTETSKEFLCVCLLGKVIQFFSPTFTLLFTSVLSQPFPRFPSLSPPLFVSSLLSFSHPLITPLTLSSFLPRLYPKPHFQPITKDNH